MNQLSPNRRRRPGSPVLQITGLAKTFGGVRALQGVDLTVKAGEIHGLLGENGSGKSTLIKVLAGFHAPDPGAHLEVNGEQVSLPLRRARSTVWECASCTRTWAWSQPDGAGEPPIDGCPPRFPLVDVRGRRAHQGAWSVQLVPRARRSTRWTGSVDLRPAHRTCAFVRAVQTSRTRRRPTRGRRSWSSTSRRCTCPRIGTSASSSTLILTRVVASGAGRPLHLPRPTRRPATSPTGSPCCGTGRVRRHCVDGGRVRDAETRRAHRRSRSWPRRSARPGAPASLRDRTPGPRSMVRPARWSARPAGPRRTAGEVLGRDRPVRVRLRGPFPTCCSAFGSADSGEVTVRRPPRTFRGPSSARSVAVGVGLGCWRTDRRRPPRRRGLVAENMMMLRSSARFGAGGCLQTQPLRNGLEQRAEFAGCRRRRDA